MQRVKRQLRTMWPDVRFDATRIRVPGGRGDAEEGESIVALRATLIGASREESKLLRRALYEWIGQELYPIDRSRLVVTVLFE